MRNLRVAQSGQRTNVQGKHVTKKVLLATPDNEYQLMRSDLAYVDLPGHLSLHEPTQTIEFVYFPNRGMVSQVVVTKDGRRWKWAWWETKATLGQDWQLA